MTSTDELLEYQDPRARRPTQKIKQLNTNNVQNKKRILPIKRNRKAINGGEKLIGPFI